MHQVLLDITHSLWSVQLSWRQGPNLLAKLKARFMSVAYEPLLEPRPWFKRPQFPLWPERWQASTFQLEVEEVPGCAGHLHSYVHESCSAWFPNGGCFSCDWAWIHQAHTFKIYKLSPIKNTEIKLGWRGRTQTCWFLREGTDCLIFSLPAGQSSFSRRVWELPFSRAEQRPHCRTVARWMWSSWRGRCGDLAMIPQSLCAVTRTSQLPEWGSWLVLLHSTDWWCGFWKLLCLVCVLVDKDQK